MAPEAVQPLRISKSASQSPSKMASPSAARALQEISPMGVRRNSPSFDQATKKLNFPSDSSPFEASVLGSSPRNFWTKRDAVSPSRLGSENVPLRSSDKTLSHRSSIEDLKKASRVTRSNMFAKEHDQDYDPDSSVLVDRPLAGGRPLTAQYSDNAWANGLDDTQPKISPFKGHRRTESKTNIPFENGLNRGATPPKTISPSKLQASPQKSSLSNSSRFVTSNTFNPEAGTWSDDEDAVTDTRANTPRAELRHHKSVTFDNGPPQVNEYEMITPDPSSIASGSREGSYDSDAFDLEETFEREPSSEREDSFDDSLEDADKTPVVLPEDWRFMSPDLADTSLSKDFDDPFEESQPQQEDGGLRSSSGTSDGDERPLPPLPPSKQTTPNDDNSNARAGSMSPSFRAHPSPPRPASISKAEILGMQASPMPLEERLRLMALQDQEDAAKADAKGIIDFFNRGEGRNDDALGENHVEPSKDRQGPPRISRESILRKLQEQQFDSMEFEDSSPAQKRQSTQSIDYANLDPDVPIPSRENSSLHHYIASNTGLKDEEDENVRIIDKYSSPPSCRSSPAASEGYGPEASVIHHEVPESDREDTPVHEATLDEEPTNAGNLESDDQTKRPRFTFPDLDRQVFAERGLATAPPQNRMSLPEFTSFGDDDFAFGLGNFLSQSPPEAPVVSTFTSSSPQRDASILSSEKSLEPIPESPKLARLSLDPAQRPITPREQTRASIHTENDEVVSTPDSVIHHPEQSELYDAEEEQGEPEESTHESLVIPEPVATIKAPGGKLKTRPSATPADLRAMVTARRQASGERPSSVAEHEENLVEGEEEGLTPGSDLKLSVPVEGGLGLSEELERVIEAQKRGYLMRQNTKVVVASARQASGESKASDTTTERAPSITAKEPKSSGDSPQKAGNTAWKTEPWNGKMRRQSTRRNSIMPDMPLSTGPVPPLPGHERNLATDILSEDATAPSVDDPNTERGRVFVKVMSVKDLDLPLPKNERSYFQLTLDNGLHCVTTSWLELGRTAVIGQEFELVVFDELEFQLTLQTSLERPQSQAGSVKSTVSSTPSVKAQKAPALSRLFQSPKKRRELERKQKEEEEQAQLQRQRELEAQRASREPTAWDLQNQLVGPDGSFARAYVSLSNHEEQAFGRPCIIDVPCFNEWAVEDKEITDSTRSKLGGAQRRPPYKIGRMELQLLFIPKPNGAQDEDMPKSMAAAVKQLKETETSSTVYFEGHLSQQGGDCPYWRRRFFKLSGTKLTAYHEATRQPRVSISLAKATKLIDDRSQLTKADGSPTKTGRARRRSAFAEEEEGYMFVEEGFRIRFANGEIIDFYADKAADKEAWMKVLSQVVGKDVEKQTWMSLVLAKERAMRTQPRAAAAPHLKPPSRGTSKSAPTSPQKGPTIPERKSAPKATMPPPPPVEKSPRHMGRASIPSKPGSTPRASLAKQPTPAASPTKASPAKPSPAKASPTKQSSAMPTPRLQKLSGKRQGVRSMIF